MTAGRKISLSCEWILVLVVQCRVVKTTWNYIYIVNKSGLNRLCVCAHICTHIITYNQRKRGYQFERDGMGWREDTWEELENRKGGGKWWIHILKYEIKLYIRINILLTIKWTSVYHVSHIDTLLQDELCTKAHTKKYIQHSQAIKQWVLIYSRDVLRK